MTILGTCAVLFVCDKHCIYEEPSLWKPWTLFKYTWELSFGLAIEWYKSLVALMELQTVQTSKLLLHEHGQKSFKHSYVFKLQLTDLI